MGNQFSRFHSRHHHRQHCARNCRRLHGHQRYFNHNCNQHGHICPSNRVAYPLMCMSCLNFACMPNLLHVPSSKMFDFYSAYNNMDNAWCSSSLNLGFDELDYFNGGFDLEQHFMAF
jgi:hypothetical protein